MKRDENNKEYRRLAIAAARLRSDGSSQAAIAKILGESQPEVSRLIAFAVTHRYLSSGPGFLRANVDKTDDEAVENQYFLKNKLIECLRPLLPARQLLEVRIVHAGEDDFAFAAAARVSELLTRSHQIGIMWGRTLFELVNGIAARGDDLRSLAGRDIKCIPLCGDPLFLINDRRVQYSASYLAAKLNQVLNANPATATSLPCLSGVPAYISRQRARESGASELIWERFLKGIPGYRDIFGDEDNHEGGRVAEVDAILTGVGIVVVTKERPGYETGDFIAERVTQDKIEKQDLYDLIYGDIGGWLIEREGLSGADRATVRNLNAGWMGLQAADLQRVARRAKPGGSPGIIVVASGRWKAAMVKALVRRGLIQQLIVSSDLAHALITSK